ncbi:MAG: tetratricopeptide repeat protein [Chloroflexi bacterium]|nr:tetratricopeptide repeat protein [Chloroflexota bacterium]
MYLEPTIQRKKKRRSSPLRIVFLLVLISAGIYVYVIIQQEQVASPFVPTPTPTRAAFSYISEANELYFQGRMTETIAAYEQAIELEPSDVSPYIPLTRLLILEGRMNEAMQRAGQAIQKSPENAAAWAVQGMAYDWNGDVPEAIEACNRAIDLDPTYAEGYAYLAEAYADAGRWAEANQAAETALQLNDRSVDAHRNYGYTLEIQGNYWGALEAYEQALEIHPNLSYIHVSVGRNYRRLGDFDAALDSFQRAAQVNPGNAQAHFELGWTYLTILGDYDQAGIYFEQATKVDPQFGRAFGGLAITFWQHRNYEDAIPNFERSIKLASSASRQMAKSFYITIEERDRNALEPSLDVVMRGDLNSTAPNNPNNLRATLLPDGTEYDEAWADARGVVAFNAWTGKYTIDLVGLPRLDSSQVYVGWFERLKTLSGDRVNTGPLQRFVDGSITAELEATWVAGPAIDYLYTLGLAYFYKAECDKAYPLFDAALAIDPEEPNALEGIRLCQAAGD